MARIPHTPWTLAFGALLLLVGPLLPNAYSQVEPSPSRLRINVFVDRSNEADPNVIRTALNRWAAVLTPSSNFKIGSKVVTDQKRWAESLDSAAFDLYGLYAYQYLEMEASAVLRPALITTADNGPMSTFLLISRTGEKITSVGDLRGKKIVVDTGGFGELPLTWLITKLATVATLAEVPTYADVSPVQTPARALLPVYFGKADACIVTRSAFTKRDSSQPRYHLETCPDSQIPTTARLTVRLPPRLPHRRCRKNCHRGHAADQ